jgi:hypothetical protein
MVFVPTLRRLTLHFHFHLIHLRDNTATQTNARSQGLDIDDQLLLRNCIDTPGVFGTYEADFQLC